jgi:cell division protein FtsI (penicillin-binding protein 3)
MNTTVLTRSGNRTPTKPPTGKPPTKRRPRTRRRLMVFLCLVTALFISAIVRVGLLQTVQSTSLANYGESQRLRQISLPAARGVVFDRNGVELAVSVPSYSVWVDPRLMGEDKNATLSALISTLNLDTKTIEGLVDKLNSTSEFAWVQRQLDAPTADAVKALGLKGVYIQNEPHRYLPADKMARSILGSTDLDGGGTSGVELMFNDTLTGTPGYIKRELDRDGRSIPTGLREEVPAIPGQDLVLTIDQRLQYQTEQLLIGTVTETKAKGGMVIVLDTKTGDLLAVANVVRNPKDLTSVVVSSANSAFVETYEPGSVAKIIAASGALQEGTIDMTTKWHIPSQYKVWDAVIKDDDSEPRPADLSIGDIIAQSSNIGTVKLAQSIGAEKLDGYFRSFGFGSQSGVNFPGETPGLLPTWKKWSGTQRATVAYGQGIGVTAVQLAAAMNTIANGGTYVAPRLVHSFIDRVGTERLADPSPTHEAISAATAAEMTTALRKVVCTGTAKDTAKITGYQVAGKTGTAYKAQNVKGEADGYKDATGAYRYYASFAGFVPAEAPRVTVLVSIDEPALEVRFGRLAAAPLFTQVAEEALRSMKVPPSGSNGC